MKGERAPQSGPHISSGLAVVAALRCTLSDPFLESVCPFNLYLGVHVELRAARQRDPCRRSWKARFRFSGVPFVRLLVACAFEPG